LFLKRFDFFLVIFVTSKWYQYCFHLVGVVNLSLSFCSLLPIMCLLIDPFLLCLKNKFLKVWFLWITSSKTLRNCRHLMAWVKSVVGKLIEVVRSICFGTAFFIIFPPMGRMCFICTVGSRFLEYSTREYMKEENDWCSIIFF